MNRIEIPLSKTKLLLLLAGSILFVAAGFFCIMVVADGYAKYSSIFLKGVGVVAILFFGATGVSATKKIFDNKMGLIIDDRGMTDNSSGVSIGLIKWSDITAITTEEISSSKFLLIYVTNPEYYLNQAKGFKRKMMKANYSMYGTPLSMTSNGLKCKFSELEQLIHKYFNNYRKTDSTNI